MLWLERLWFLLLKKSKSRKMKHCDEHPANRRIELSRILKWSYVTSTVKILLGNLRYCVLKKLVLF